MTTSAMRNQLIAFLADADTQKIKGLYALLEDNIREKNTPALTEKQLIFLSEERRKHLSGETKSYSWEEVKGMIRKRKAS